MKPEGTMERVTLLDSTLRDGAQGEGISFSVSDKINITLALDELGMDFIEAGNPGSNPKDIEFFAAVRNERLRHAKLAAFGPTRRKGVAAESDPGLASLLAADTETVVVFGKSWDLHVSRILGATLEENLAMIRDSVALLVREGRRVIYDAEHFFDGFGANPDYALASLAAAAEAGADCVVLCDTNGGSLPSRIADYSAIVSELIDLPFGIHAHNDSGWPWPTRWPPWTPVRCTCRARWPASASAAATRTFPPC
jgi:2-isopropylmalate synthase